MDNVITVNSEDDKFLTRKRKSQSPNNERTRKRTRSHNKITMPEQHPSPRTPASSQPVDMSSSGDEHRIDIISLPRKQKSILQPSGGKYSRKAAGRRRSLLAAHSNQNGESESIQDASVIDSPPITILTKAEDLNLISNTATNRPSPDTTTNSEFLPRKYLELKFVEYDLPSTDPQGPGDLWTCTFEGCFYRVHGASTPNGKARVKEHFRIHASQAQDKIDLVLNESRPYLPVK